MTGRDVDTVGYRDVPHGGGLCDMPSWCFGGRRRVGSCVTDKVSFNLCASSGC